MTDTDTALVRRAQGGDTLAMPSAADEARSARLRPGRRLGIEPTVT